MSLLGEAVDRKVLARAEEVGRARAAEARKKGLIELGHAIHEFVLAVDADVGQVEGTELAHLIERHYRVRVGVFKAIGLTPPSLHEQGLELAKRLSEIELGLKPGKKPAKKAAKRKAGKKARPRRKTPAPHRRRKGRR